MEEHEIIVSTVLYLLRTYGEKVKIVEVSTKKHEFIKEFLAKKHIPKKVIDGIRFKSTGADIVAKLWDGGRILKIEAKGGNKGVTNKIHTSLGQFICLKESPSGRYWFAFAFPHSWRDKVREMLRNSNGETKPIIKDIIDKYSPEPNYQGLRFCFVEDNGKVIRETWRKTLR